MKSFWMIEKPEPGGVYWFSSIDHYPDSDCCYAKWFTPNATKAMRFVCERDALHVMHYLFPSNWPRIFNVTEHLWMDGEITKEVGK